MFPVPGKPGEFTSEELVRSVVIVPAANVDTARIFGHAFMVLRDSPNTVDETLPTPLSASGLNPPTHFACFKTWTRSELDAVHKLLADKRLEGHSYITNRKLGRGDDRATLLASMAHIEGSDVQTEAALGLKRING